MIHIYTNLYLRSFARYVIINKFRTNKPSHSNKACVGKK